MERLLAWFDWPIKLLLWLSLLVGFLMMMHIAADVVGRVVFNHPLSGTTEIVSAYYMVAVAYLPLAWIARQDDHIIVELFTRNLAVGNLQRLTTTIESLGLDLIWFGVLVVKYLEIGLLTPPVGFNVYVIKGVVGDTIPLETIFRGVSWFLFCELIVVMLLVAFPEISLFLPNSMN